MDNASRRRRGCADSHYGYGVGAITTSPRGGNFATLYLLPPSPTDTRLKAPVDSPQLPVLGLEPRAPGSNPAFDDLLDQAARSAEIEEQDALYLEAQRLVVDDPVDIYLAWPGGHALVAPWVEGLVLTPIDWFPGSLFLNQVSIAPHG